MNLILSNPKIEDMKISPPPFFAFIDSVDFYVSHKSHFFSFDEFKQRLSHYLRKNNMNCDNIYSVFSISVCAVSVFVSFLMTL